MAEAQGTNCVVDVPQGCHWTIHNIPFGIFTAEVNMDTPHIATALGEYVVDLHNLVTHGFLKGEIFQNGTVFQQPLLNDFMELGRPAWKAARAELQNLLSGADSPLRSNNELRNAVLIPMKNCTMLLPARIGDYTDFYSSFYHAENVGKLFRPNEAALKPNWLHLPVGYHGRASSVVVSGTPITRPTGQVKPPDSDPVDRPCKVLDFEVEVAFYYGGKASQMGRRIPLSECHDHIFGVVLMNDWSARDIQKWEYVPLGPFNGKNFATSVSPWIVTMEALEPFKCAGMKQNKEGKVPLPYLQDDNIRSYDINLEVSIKPQGGETLKVGQTNTQNLYWKFEQQLAHHSSTGCPFKPGDMCGSGTISGPDVGQFGSMLEITKGFKEPLQLAEGVERKALGDHDDCIMTGYCEKDGVFVGFGECTGVVLPACAL